MDGTFRDESYRLGEPFDSLKRLVRKTNSVFFTDIDNDGDLDIFVGNRGGGNNLYINNGSGWFRDIAKEAGVYEPELFTYGCAIADFDNDGLLDIFLVYLGGVKFYKNMGIKEGIPIFSDVTTKWVPLPAEFDRYNTSCVVFNVEEEGDIDVVFSQSLGRGVFLRNRLNEPFSENEVVKNFIKVKLKGTRGNRDAIGAKLRLYKNMKLVASPEVCAGSGYASSISKIQHFGVDDENAKYELEVKFPAVAGRKVIKRLKVKPGEFVFVSEADDLEFNNLVRKLCVVLRRSSFRDEVFKLVILIFIFVLILKLALVRERILWMSILPGVALHVFSKIAIYMSYRIWFNPYYWTMNLSNLLVEDLLPFFISLLGFLFCKCLAKIQKSQRYQWGNSW